MKTYKSSGIVYGNFWGGGEGAYQAENLPYKRDPYKSKKALLKEATEMLDGRLDSGMGYESLIGAMLEIEEIETIKKNGKQFTRSEFETVFIGDLTDKQKDFLESIIY